MLASFVTYVIAILAWSFRLLQDLSKDIDQDQEVRSLFQGAFAHDLLRGLRPNTRPHVHVRIIPNHTDHHIDNEVRNLFKGAVTYFVLVGSVLWCLEVHYCQHLLPFYISALGLSFHILWHFGAAMGCYMLITYLIAVHLRALKREFDVKWLYGVLPICCLLTATNDPLPSRTIIIPVHDTCIPPYNPPIPAIHPQKPTKRNWVSAKLINFFKNSWSVL